MAGKLYALLVGIDRYANPRQAPHLRGCVADVAGMHGLLINQLGVPADQVRLLTARMDGSESAEQLATRRNILDGWQRHLAQAGDGDQVFFHYSGHGSQARSVDPNEADGYDETLVAHDSRTPDVYDILDKELAALIAEVERRGAQVTVFLDCCHSGSGTRAAAGENQPLVRRCPTDERTRPPHTVLAGAATAGGTRAARAPSGWVPLGNHVLLAGCRDEELSNEYRSPETYQWQGATTYFFLKAMAGYRPGMTWRDIHDIVQTQVHAVYAAQTPQLEGPGHLEVFGGAGRTVAGYLLVTEVDGQTHVKVNGGVAVGLSTGSQLTIYAPAGDLQGAPQATATVEEVKVDHAWARLDKPAVVELASRARITAYGYADQTHVVAVDDESVRAKLATLRDGAPSPFLKVVSSSDPAETPELVVAVRSGRYSIEDAAGNQLVDETPLADDEGAGRVAAALEHLAIYRNVATLRNPAPDSSLRDAVRIAEPVIAQRSRSGRIVGDAKPIRGAGGEAVVVSGQRNIAFDIHNTTERTLYLAVFSLDSNYGITRYLPSRASYETVAPGGVIQVSVPQLYLTNPRLSRAVETFKVLATTFPTSFDVLQMPELNRGELHGQAASRDASPLGQLLHGLRHTATRPAAPMEEDETGDNWTTAQLAITVLAAQQETALPPGATQVTVDQETEMVLHKPAAFDGTLILSSVEQATRGADSTGGLEPPPGLSGAAAAPYFRPVTLGESTRATGSSPTVLSVAADAGQLESVTADAPLQLEFAVDDEPGLAGVVPIAYDGEFYYLAGQPALAGGPAAATSRAAPAGGKRRMAVTVDFLPPPVEEEGEVGTRDLKRTTRLFLYKVFSGDLPVDAGLRRAELREGKAVFTPVTAADIQSARRVALMIHGFNADTDWLIEKVWSWVQNNGAYDLCLAYDYETFGTGIRQNGERLAAALTEQLPFGPDDGRQLDIYAHSMGTQVARALVELCGGAAYVDRVFMGGAPNAGSPLAKGRALVPWLGNVLLNLAGSAPPALIAHWLLNRAVASGQGVVDLDPDSEFYREINRLQNPPGDVAYYVQIGDNSASQVDWKKLSDKLMRGLDVGLDLLFRGDNDLAVGVASATTLQGRWPRFTHAVLAVNHFQYFHSEEGQRILARWLSQ